MLQRNDVDHQDLFNVFNFLYGNTFFNCIQKIESDFSKIELLANSKIIINALKKIPFCDFRIEKILTKLRSKF